MLPECGLIGGKRVAVPTFVGRASLSRPDAALAFAPAMTLSIDASVQPAAEHGADAGLDHVLAPPPSSELETGPYGFGVSHEGTSVIDLGNGDERYFLDALAPATASSTTQDGCSQPAGPRSGEEALPSCRSMERPCQHLITSSRSRRTPRISAPRRPKRPITAGTRLHTLRRVRCWPDPSPRKTSMGQGQRGRPRRVHVVSNMELSRACPAFPAAADVESRPARRLPMKAKREPGSRSGPARTAGA